ncbi:MAG: hypothetical protein ACE5KT_10445 [Methanosarcinales archaeon]
MNKNIPKIDLKKIDELEKDHERVRETVIRWARRSINDPDLLWDTAMANAADELGVNKAEFVTLIFGCEPLEDVAYAFGLYRNWKKAKIERIKRNKKISIKTKGEISAN